jgi:hypothetical protein
LHGPELSFEFGKDTGCIFEALEGLGRLGVGLQEINGENGAHKERRMT